MEEWQTSVRELEDFLRGKKEEEKYLDPGLPEVEDAGKRLAGLTGT